MQPILQDIPIAIPRIHCIIRNEIWRLWLMHHVIYCHVLLILSGEPASSMIQHWEKSEFVKSDHVREVFE